MLIIYDNYIYISGCLLNISMNELYVVNYNTLLTKAVKHFWNTRKSQLSGRSKIDQGNRSAVTGGKQLDGFIDLLVKISKDSGVPENCIYIKGNSLPGFFRATKDWDFAIISPKNQLLAVVELKSQVGSFGNNFNNRTEEALGNAIDIWTAFRENGLPQTQLPWIGYLIVVEKTDKSSSIVRTKEPYYPARPEFKDTSYLDRYVLFSKNLCKKDIIRRHL